MHTTILVIKFKELIKRFKFSLVFIFIGFSLWVSVPKEVVYSGNIFGTYYRIKMYVPKWHFNQFIKQDILKVFEDYNATFSTYSSSSLISQFNRLNVGNEIEVSDTFINIAQFGFALYEQSGGVWDASIEPLYALWRFDSVQPVIPHYKDIHSVLKYVGYEKLLILDNKIAKSQPGFSLDFSSLAKGDCVDKIGQLLLQKGIKDFFIDLGGEILVHGNKPNGKSWKVGIANPLNDKEYFNILSLTKGALATSGDYQHFFVGLCGNHTRTYS